MVKNERNGKKLPKMVNEVKRPKGLHLEVGARRAPRLLVYYIRLHYNTIQFITDSATQCGSGLKSKVFHSNM